MSAKRVCLCPMLGIQILLPKAYKIALVWYNEVRGEGSSFATSIVPTREETVVKCATFTGHKYL